MLQLNNAFSAQTIILTLTELQTINNPYYLFVFTQSTTKQVVSFIKSSDDDESDYPERYNQFTINTAQLFAGAQAGEWVYTVYQQDDDTNTNTAGLPVLERGKMQLQTGSSFSYTTYNLNTTYKAYNGWDTNKQKRG